LTHPPRRSGVTHAAAAACPVPRRKITDAGRPIYPGRPTRRGHDVPGKQAGAGRVHRGIASRTAGGGREWGPDMTMGTAGPRGLGTRRPRGSTRTPGGGRSATQLASPLTRRDITAIADDAARAA